MASTTYYDDGVITVTQTELKTTNYTLYLDKITSVDVASLTMGKTLLVPLSLSLVPIGFFGFLFRGFMLRPMLIMLIPLLLLGLAAFFFRNTRVMLHTTGGNVIVAQKLGFGEHLEELKQYGDLKRAIENAKTGAPIPPR